MNRVRLPVLAVAASLVSLSLLASCGGSGSPTSVPTPIATPKPEPTPTPDPNVPPAGSGCGEPYPPKITRLNVKVHLKDHDYWTLDSTPLVGPDGAFCAAIGFTDGRLFCPVRAEGRGLAALDEPTLAALAADPDAVRRLRDRHADVLAALGGRFQVREGAVVVPGGEEEEPVWARVVARAPGCRWRSSWPCSRRTRDAGPCSTIRWPASTRHASASPSVCTCPRVPRARAPCSPWPRPSSARWPGGTPREAPSSGRRRMPPGCCGRCGSRTTARSHPRRRGCSGSGLRQGEDGLASRGGHAGGLVGARRGRLAGAADRRGRPVGADAAPRAATFAQRVFGAAGQEALPDVLAAVRALPAARSLLLALERIGTRPPGALRRGGEGRAPRRRGVGPGGRAAGPGGRCRERWASSIAPASRARSTSRRPSGCCGRSSRCRGRAPGRARGLAAWVEGVLLPELGRAVHGTQPPGEPETTILRAMSGDRVDGREALTPFEWEGLWYRADTGRAESARLSRVRVRQGGAGLAEALRGVPPRPRRSPNRAPARSGRLSSPWSTRRTWGDPDGPVLARADPSLRHDFGPDRGRCPRRSWAPACPGTCGWGSLLGLERALARLSLHGLAGDALPEGPPVLDVPGRRLLPRFPRCS